MWLSVVVSCVVDFVVACVVDVVVDCVVGVVVACVVGVVVACVVGVVVACVVASGTGGEGEQDNEAKSATVSFVMSVENSV